MLTGPTSAGQHPAVPLTHRQCIAAGFQRAAGCADGARPWVQVQRYHPKGSYPVCGQVVELRENGAEWFKVETDIGPVWADSRHVRLCSGDGRCTCEAEPSMQAGRSAQVNRHPIEKPGSTGQPSIGINQKPADSTGQETEGAGDV